MFGTTKTITILGLDEYIHPLAIATYSRGSRVGLERLGTESSAKLLAPLSLHL